MQTPSPYRSLVLLLSAHTVVMCANKLVMLGFVLCGEPLINIDHDIGFPVVLKSTNPHSGCLCPHSSYVYPHSGYVCFCFVGGGNP